jgi:hypothetical protein
VISQQEDQGQHDQKHHPHDPECFDKRKHGGMPWTIPERTAQALRDAI